MKRQILVDVLSATAGVGWTVIPGVLYYVRRQGLKTLLVTLWVIMNAVFIASNLAAEIM